MMAGSMRLCKEWIALGKPSLQVAYSNVKYS